MSNFESILRDAMKQGVSIEDVMKDISAAANAIQKEIAAASKYDKYNGPAYKTFGTMAGDATNAVLLTSKIKPEDMAIVMAHFVCQNVPGYAAAMAKMDMDPIDTYTSLMKSQIAAAKVITDTQDKPDNEKEAAIFAHLLDEIINSLNGHDSMFGGKGLRYLMPHETMHGTVLSSAQTDHQKIADFFKKIGL